VVSGWSFNASALNGDAMCCVGANALMIYSIDRSILILPAALYEPIQIQVNFVFTVNASHGEWVESLNTRRLKRRVVMPRKAVLQKQYLK
jgi:hypothetical protein